MRRQGRIIFRPGPGPAGKLHYCWFAGTSRPENPFARLFGSQRSRKSQGQDLASGQFKGIDRLLTIVFGQRLGLNKHILVRPYDEVGAMFGHAPFLGRAHQFVEAIQRGP